MWGKCQMHVQLKAKSTMLNDVYFLTEGHAKMLVFPVQESEHQSRPEAVKTEEFFWRPSLPE